MTNVEVFNINNFASCTSAICGTLKWSRAFFTLMDQKHAQKNYNPSMKKNEFEWTGPREFDLDQSSHLYTMCITNYETYC